jgi:hypothetical protein
MLQGGKEGRDDEAEEDILKGVGKRIGRRNEEQKEQEEQDPRISHIGLFPLQFFPRGLWRSVFSRDISPL